MNYFFKDLVLLVLNVCMGVRMCMHVHTHKHTCSYPWRLEVSKPPGGEVTGNCESPDMGAGDQGLGALQEHYAILIAGPSL